MQAQTGAPMVRKYIDAPLPRAPRPFTEREQAAVDAVRAAGDAGAGLIGGTGEVLSFRQFKDAGLLYAANKEFFHRFGYALAFAEDDDGEITGFYLEGRGTDFWCYDTDVQDEMHDLTSATLAPHHTSEARSHINVNPDAR